MVVGPLGGLRIDATGRRRRMEVIPRVVRVRMPIPPTFPHAVPPHLLVVDIEIIVAVPANLESGGCLVRVVVAGQPDTEV